MIKIIGGQENTAHALKVDPYVPFSFETSESEGLAPFHWMIRNGDDLIELGLIPKTGAVCRVVVVSFQNYRITTNPWMPLSSERAVGLPICDLTAWKLIDEKNFGQRFIDFPTTIEVHVGPTYVRVWLGSSALSIRQCHTVGQVDFGVDAQGALSALDFHDLSAEQLRTLSKHLGQKNPVKKT